MRKLLIIILILISPKARALEDGVLYGMALHGSPKYGSSFTNFDYVNPNAPKGGELRLAALGTGFTTFNPFTIKGIPPAGVGLLYDTLFKDSEDEAFSKYPLIAEKAEIPFNRDWIEFTINKKAKFSDGTSITAKDVEFSFNILKDKGTPTFRSYFKDVKRIQVRSDYKIRFYIDSDNKELPLILGQLPVLPKHYWEDKDFSKTTLDRDIVTSGPYKIENFDASKDIVYKRLDDYWAKDLPVNKGFYNFDTIKYDYYRDSTVALEAFRSGEYDIRIENEAKKWANGYDNFEAREEGDVILEKFNHQMPVGMQGFVYNTRRDIFKDKNVRKALAYAFDFNWTNEKLFFGQYKRTNSYFENSELSGAATLPTNGELDILFFYKNSVPNEVFTKIYNPPSTEHSGIRYNLKKALYILTENGWEVDDDSKKLVNEETGEPFEFEILLDSSMSSAFERVTLPFIKNLEKIGITASIKKVDQNQFKNLVDEFNYDMIIGLWGQSLSPGNEQAYYWGSKSADMKTSQNYAGIKDDVVDSLIKDIIKAENRVELVNLTKVLDRVLLFGYYVIPHWYIDYSRVAYWNKFGKPETVPMKGVDFMTWWDD